MCIAYDLLHHINVYYACMCVRIHLYRDSCSVTCLFVQVCVHMYVSIYIYVYVYMYI